MTGMSDVVQTYSVYYILELTIHRFLAQFSAKNYFSGACTWTCKLKKGIRYRNSIFIIANSTLQCVVPIYTLTSEICVEWLVFPGMVTL